MATVATLIQILCEFIMKIMFNWSSFLLIHRMFYSHWIYYVFRFLKLVIARKSQPFQNMRIPRLSKSSDSLSIITTLVKKL